MNTTVKENWTFIDFIACIYILNVVLTSWRPAPLAFRYSSLRIVSPHKNWPSPTPTWHHEVTFAYVSGAAICACAMDESQRELIPTSSSLIPLWKPCQKRRCHWATKYAARSLLSPAIDVDSLPPSPVPDTAWVKRSLPVIARSLLRGHSGFVYIDCTVLSNVISVCERRFNSTVQFCTFILSCQFIYLCFLKTSFIGKLSQWQRIFTASILLSIPYMTRIIESQLTFHDY